MFDKNKSLICIQRPNLDGWGTDPAALLPSRQPMIICPLLWWPEWKHKLAARSNKPASCFPPFSFSWQINNFSALLPKWKKKRITGGEQCVTWSFHFAGCRFYHRIAKWYWCVFLELDKELNASFWLPVHLLFIKSQMQGFRRLHLWLSKLGPKMSLCVSYGCVYLMLHQPGFSCIITSIRSN